MNETLIVIASKEEFEGLFPEVSAESAQESPVAVETLYDVFICGVGVLEFSANLAFILSKKQYKRVIQLGICGAYYGHDLQLCDVVRVDSEILGDMGVQDRNGHFVPWSEVSGESITYAGESPWNLPLGLASLKSVAGVTVSCSTGTRYLSLRRSGMFNADVESMEGAACFAVCRRFGVPAFQFRAVSNIATDRDVSAWKIPEALAALKSAVLCPEYFS